MSRRKNSENELDKYARSGEPGYREKSLAWQTAIGLQDVDGLKTSEYLLATAKDHIEGKIDIAAAQDRLRSYYQEKAEKGQVDENAKEADLVSARIAEIISEKTFRFSPSGLKAIHKRLFSGVFDHAGSFRKYNITKKEWVLKGKSVLYSSYESIPETLEYDFNNEKSFSYAGLSKKDIIKHLADFTSNIWQIHPFCEGNTRTTATFILKYLRSLGLKAKSELFAENSWYFRNALVRANYNDLANGIRETTVFLEAFFDDLLNDAAHPLKNRDLHIDAKSAISKCKNCTLKEQAVLKEIKKDPSVTQKALAQITGISERSVKAITVALQQKGLLKRQNGKRRGKWELLD